MTENLQSAFRIPHSAIEASAIVLRGTTWAHTRGFAPLVATSQVFSDFHPEVEIVWDKRSLWAFGEGPLDELAKEFDLLIFDHPFTGFAAERELFLPLDQHLPTNILSDLKSQSAGPSYRSYEYNGHQWALPIDAAAQVSVSRPDLFSQRGLRVPQTWDEVISLAKETGKVTIPLTRMGALGSFFTLCANQGAAPFESDAPPVVAREVGESALEKLKALYSCVDPACLETSPVQALNLMASTDTFIYAPLLYGYSNYSRLGYAPHQLAFHNIPAAASFGCRGATLGGAGLAISTRSRHQAEALEYASWVAGAECQRSLYTLSGGQPGNRLAWEDDLANRVTNNFFRDTLETLEHAYLRPNYMGFTVFQTRAAELLYELLKGKQSTSNVLDGFDRIYAESRSVRV